MNEEYGAECMDVVLLAEHVVAHPELAHLIIPNGAALDKLARAQQNSFRLPGCKLVTSTQRTVRTA